MMEMPEMPDDETWVRVAEVSDVDTGQGFETGQVVNGEEVALFRLEDGFHALGECPHERGPLSQGIVEDGTVICPWHSARFDIRSGRCLAAPSACRTSGEVAVGDVSLPVVRDCTRFEVRVEHQVVLVRAPR